MLVEYEALGFVHEGGIDLTKPNDVEYGSHSALRFYKEETKVECSSEHEDSMEMQLVKPVHA